MSSKAQYAATKLIEEEISYALGLASRGQLRDVYARMESVQSIIKEFTLSEDLLTEALPTIYDKFMEAECYQMAADFAKKFGL